VNHEASFAFTQNREIHLRPSNRRLIGIEYLALVSDSWRRSDDRIESSGPYIIEEKEHEVMAGENSGCGEWERRILFELTAMCELQLTRGDSK